jgi:hypothetical protein
MQGRGQGQGQNLRGPYGHESGFKSRPSDSGCYCLHHCAAGIPPTLITLVFLKLNLTNQNMHRRGQNLRGPYSYVITGPNPQVYRKVPIINPVHRYRASQHSWRPGRSTKLAVGASGIHRTPTANRAPSADLYGTRKHTGMVFFPPIPGARRGSGGRLLTLPPITIVDLPLNHFCVA